MNIIRKLCMNSNGFVWSCLLTVCAGVYAGVVMLVRVAL